MTRRQSSTWSIKQIRMGWCGMKKGDPSLMEE